MAYQNVGTPRFYIDRLLLYNSLGLGFEAQILQGTNDEPDFGERIGAPSIFDLNPTVAGSFQGASHMFKILPRSVFKINYFAVFGHSLNTTHKPYFIVEDPETGTYPNTGHIPSEDIDTLLNFEPNVDNYLSEKGGFSLFTLSQDIEHIETDFFVYEGDPTSYEVHPWAVSIGGYYNMPHSPDISLTMTREMDGVKKIRNKGGFDLINHKYLKSPYWNGRAAWEIGSSTYDQRTSRYGRRTWDLSFSYIQDEDIFPEVIDINAYESLNPAGNTLLDDNTFYNQVIHQTNGGRLPFIFQPDNTNFNADSFAICKFDMEKFSFEQVANGVYNIKLKIREVW